MIRIIVSITKLIYDARLIRNVRDLLRCICDMLWCFSVMFSYVAPIWGSCMYGRAVDHSSFFWAPRLVVGSTPREASFRLQRGMCWSNWGAYRSAIGEKSSLILRFFDKTQLCEKCLLGRSAQCWSNWGAYRSAIGRKCSFNGAIWSAVLIELECLPFGKREKKEF